MPISCQDPTAAVSSPDDARRGLPQHCETRPSSSHKEKVLLRSQPALPALSRRQRPPRSPFRAPTLAAPFLAEHASALLQTAPSRLLPHILLPLSLWQAPLVLQYSRPRRLASRLVTTDTTLGRHSTRLRLAQSRRQASPPASLATDSLPLE